MTNNTLPSLDDFSRTSSRLSGTYELVTSISAINTPFSTSPSTPSLPTVPVETDEMAEAVTPFKGDKEDESPEDFLRAFYRRMGDKPDDTKKAQFPYYLQAYSVADEWYDDLTANEKKSWTDIEAAFRKRWPKKKQVKKTEEEYEDEIVGKILTTEELGKKEKIEGMEVYSHIAWADKLATIVKSAKLEKTTTHIRQVRRNLPEILGDKVGTGHADWTAFLQAIRDVDVDYIRDRVARRNKELEGSRAVDRRLRMLEVSKSPTAPLRQQLSSVVISNQPPGPNVNAANIGDPFTNAGGGQGNLRFAANPAIPRSTRPPSTNLGPRPPPTPEQQAEIRTLLAKFPHHPDTQAGRLAHQAQQAEWVKTYGYGTRVTEKTPYPLRPGTAPVNSGECFTCGQQGHVGARTGENCQALGYRVLHPNEQQWRVICSRVLKVPRAVTNIHFLALDDYGTAFQDDVQEKGEGPST